MIVFGAILAQLCRHFGSAEDGGERILFAVRGITVLIDGFGGANVAPLFQCLTGGTGRPDPPRLRGAERRYA